MYVCIARLVRNKNEKDCVEDEDFEFCPLCDLTYISFENEVMYDLTAFVDPNETGAFCTMLVEMNESDLLNDVSC